jgi:Rps23 Pro-64 3,4-dihydroxylase Tpa1-like proline 4-hydroxylase
MSTDQKFQIRVNIDNPLSYNNEHFKAVILDDLFDPEYVNECHREFMEIGEDKFVHYQNPFFEFEKYTMNKKEEMPEKIRDLFNYLHSEDFIRKVSEITGIDDLVVDEQRWGGGLHMTKEGGYLSIHKDFNVLPTSYKDGKQMLRCVNIIGYINPEWSEGEGGELEFWDREGKESLLNVEPKFNRWVIFDTRNNFHGHPHPYRGKSPRTSIAAYYYIKTSVLEEEWMSTVYLRLPWMEETEEYSKMREERANHKLRYSNLLK